MLKHWVNNFSIFLNMCKNEGVNFLNYNCKEIRTGLNICFNFQSLWIKSLGCSSLDRSYLIHSYAVCLTLLSTLPISSNIVKIILILFSIIGDFSILLVLRDFDKQNIVSLYSTLFWNFKIEDISSLHAFIYISKSYTFSPYSSSSMNVFEFMLNVWLGCPATCAGGTLGPPGLGN